MKCLDWIKFYVICLQNANHTHIINQPVPDDEGRSPPPIFVLFEAHLSQSNTLYQNSSLLKRINEKQKYQTTNIPSEALCPDNIKNTVTFMVKTI